MELLFTQKLEILLKKVCKYQQSDESHYAYGCSFAVDTYFRYPKLYAIWVLGFLGDAQGHPLLFSGCAFINWIKIGVGQSVRRISVPWDLRKTGFDMLAPNIWELRQEYYAWMSLFGLVFGFCFVCLFFYPTKEKYRIGAVEHCWFRWACIV